MPQDTKRPRQKYKTRAKQRTGYRPLALAMCSFFQRGTVPVLGRHCSVHVQHGGRLSAHLRRYAKHVLGLRITSHHFSNSSKSALLSLPTLFNGSRPIRLRVNYNGKNFIYRLTHHRPSIGFLTVRRCTGILIATIRTTRTRKLSGIQFL